MLFSLQSHPSPRSSTPLPVQAGNSSKPDVETAPAGAAEPLAQRRPSSPSTGFASLYCAAHHLRPDQFVAAVFWRTLSVRAILLGFPVFLLLRGKSAADQEFLTEVGRAATMDQYFAVEERFRRRCGRHSFVRDVLRLRVSSRRLRRLVVQTFAAAH